MHNEWGAAQKKKSTANTFIDAKKYTFPYLDSIFFFQQTTRVMQ